MNDEESKKEIEGIFASMADSWNRHDMRAYAELWREDADFVNVVGMHRHNREELLAELNWLHADRFKNTQIRIASQSVKLLSPEIALAHVTWEMTGDPGMPSHPTKDGKRQGIFTHVLQRMSEGWRFAASQNTDIVPIPDPLKQHAPAPAGVA